MNEYIGNKEIPKIKSGLFYHLPKANLNSSKYVLGITVGAINSVRLDNCLLSSTSFCMKHLNIYIYIFFPWCLLILM